MAIDVAHHPDKCSRQPPYAIPRREKGSATLHAMSHRCVAPRLKKKAGNRKMVWKAGQHAEAFS